METRTGINGFMVEVESLKISYFEARISIGRHLFILRANRDISGTIQDNWFDSIMEVIDVKGIHP